MICILFKMPLLVTWTHFESFATELILVLIAVQRSILLAQTCQTQGPRAGSDL